jgi:hypothetical protein
MVQLMLQRLREIVFVLLRLEKGNWILSSIEAQCMRLERALVGDWIGIFMYSHPDACSH